MILGIREAVEARYIQYWQQTTYNWWEMADVKPSLTAQGLGLSELKVK